MVDLFKPLKGRMIKPKVAKSKRLSLFLVFEKLSSKNILEFSFFHVTKFFGHKKKIFVSISNSNLKKKRFCG